MNHQYELKDWMDETNSQAAIENYYDSLEPEQQKACDLQARLTLVGVQAKVARDILAYEHIGEDEPF